jgi:uncharacterized membrane protein YbhN (UPF0104 family)
MAVTGVLTLGFGVLAGALVAIPAVPLVLGASHTGIPAWWVFLGVAACLVVLYPPLLNTGIGAGLRMLRRPPLEHPLRWPVVAQIMVWLVLAWLAAGMATVVLMAPFVTDPYSPTVLVTGICGFAFGSVLGMLVVIAPAGVGVREAVLGLVLTTVMTPAAAGAVIVVARFLSIVVDILLAGGAWLWARRHHLLDRAPVEAG